MIDREKFIEVKEDPGLIERESLSTVYLALDDFSFLPKFTNKIIFQVNHRPCPQPRPKARRLPMGVQIYTPNSVKVKAWKEAVRGACPVIDETLEGLVRVSSVFILQRPQAMCSKTYPSEHMIHLVKPDIDNLLKGALDALKGIVWKDDSQVLFSCYARREVWPKKDPRSSSCFFLN
jgi:Holliday junction resolvase RusA-like endonuclease